MEKRYLIVFFSVLDNVYINAVIMYVLFVVKQFTFPCDSILSDKLQDLESYLCLLKYFFLKCNACKKQIFLFVLVSRFPSPFLYCMRH